MIIEGSLSNFKSWRHFGMRFAPITGLFGTNSSGKTSILQWLLMLKQTAESSDRKQVINFGDQRRDPVELGSLRDLVHYHSTPGRLSWKLTWDSAHPLLIFNPERRGPPLGDDKITFLCEIHEEGTRPKVVKMGYEFADSKFLYKAKKGKQDYQLTAKSWNQGFHFKRRRRRIQMWELPAGPKKCYCFPDQVGSDFENTGFLEDFQLWFEEQLALIYYLGPLREYPQRHYTWSGGEPADVGRRGERVIDAILASRDQLNISRSNGRTSLTVEEYAAHWLKKLKLIHDFSVRPVAEGSSLYQVRVKKAEGAPDVLLTDVGFGISQILPVIVLCYYVPEGATVILEQPEIHLHPSVQAGLADVFIDAIKVRKIQIILESHSEHLLRRLQRRIAEQGMEGEEFTKEDVALYFCDYQNGESVLLALEVDDLGNIRNWPEGFFGDELGEVAAMTQAQIKRMGAPE